MGFMDANRERMITEIQNNPNGLVAKLARGPGIVGRLYAKYGAGVNPGYSQVFASSNNPGARDQGVPNAAAPTPPTPFTPARGFFGGHQDTPTFAGSNNSQGGGFPMNTGAGSNSVGTVPSNLEDLQSGAPPAQEDLPTYKEGGLVGSQGMPVRPGAPMPSGEGLGATAPQQGPVDPKQIEAEANRFSVQHPQEVQQIKQVIQAAMQTGELTPQELNTLVQLAKVVLMNPSSYPQVRQFAIQQGLGSDAEIPQEFDAGLLLSILIVAKAMQGGQAQMSQMPGQGVPAQGGQPPGMEAEDDEGGVMAEVHEGEYVIPKEALMYHGKKTFDALIEKSRGGK